MRGGADTADSLGQQRCIVRHAALEDIFKGTGWYLAMDVVTLAILIAFPQITLFLPETMMGSG